MKTRLPHASHGFSLVELMIAMMLGLVLIGGVITTYLSSKRTMFTTQASSQIQEVSRFALDRIGFDVRMSGFWGCISTSAPVNSALNLSAGLIDFAAGSLRGTNNDGLNQSDTLTLAFAQGQPIELAVSMADASVPLEVPAGSGWGEGDVLVANDCRSADIFQVDGRDPADPDKLFHIAGGGSTPGNVSGSLSAAYEAGTQLYQVTEVTWSIGNTAEGEPVLLRNGAEFVEGVENMQIIYGQDLDNDGSVDQYVEAGAVTNWNRVLNLKLGLLIRSEREVFDRVSAPFSFWGTQITPTDKFMRRNFSVVLGIRNRLS